MRARRLSSFIHPSSRSSAWADLSQILRAKRGTVTLLAVASVMSGLAESGILAVLAEMAAALVNGKNRAQLHLGPIHTSAALGTLIIAAFALAFARLALQAVISYFPARISADVIAKLRIELFTAFTRSSWALQSQDREGHLQELMTGQSAAATSAVVQAVQLLVAFLTFLVLVISALALNVLAALMVLVTATGLFLLMRPLNKLGRRRAKALSKETIGYAGAVGEAVRLAEEVKVFGVSDAQLDRVNQLVLNVQRPYFQTQVLAYLVPSVYQSLVYVLVIAGVAILFALGSSHAASLGAVVLLLVRAGSYGQQVQGFYQYLNQSMPWLERVLDVRRRYESLPVADGSRHLEKIRLMALEEVSYSYRAGRPVLSEIDFTVDGGETVGIVGPSGAGKSTLVQILLGLRTPDTGRYLINGIDVPAIASSDWHRLVAYVPQEPRLLHATVAENIRFFRNLDDAMVERAARLAGIHDDIVAWPNGYDEIVGPRADAVSGGQQQRICLARALAAQPEVLVLDEPTSALDPHSESLIQASLVALKHDLTLFIVAHRMSTLSICDRVMVIVDGRLQAFDTADALASDSDYYRSASLLTGTLPTSRS